MTDENGDTVEIDDLDRKIINKLLDDGRMSFRKIAEAVDSTPATVINRVERLEEEDVITGYGANVDYRKIGFDGIAAIEIVIEGEYMKVVEEELATYNNVVSVYSISGDTDILAIVKFRNRDEMTTFIKDELLSSGKVEKTITHMMFDVFKENDNPQL
jgi:DNA-binding Lrp family transcriptional regulator